MSMKTFVGAITAALMGLTVAVPVVHAGGGMGAGTNLTTCRIVQSGAPNQYQIAKIQDDFLSTTTADTLKIGALTLLCDIGATGVTLNPAPGTTGTGQPVPLTSATSVSCYSVSSADNTKIPVTVQDAFTTTFNSAGTYSVTLGAIAFVCVPAIHDDTP
jgi:hypothetical protein